MKTIRIALPLLALLILFAYLYYFISKPTSIRPVPNLFNAKEIIIIDNWKGRSPAAPIYTTYSLEQDGDHFAGTADFSIGGWFYDTKNASASIHIPNEFVQEFLLKLSTVDPLPSVYSPSYTSFDNYSEI
jgi:hypothetical protein